jgi:hypothetical protein
MKRMRNPLDESLDFPKTLHEQRRGLRNGVCVGNNDITLRPDVHFGSTRNKEGET